MKPISFTPLELLLLSAFVSLVTGIVLRAYATSKYVCKTDCIGRKEGCNKLIESLVHNNKIQFNMLRALIVHSVPDKDVQERILNTAVKYEQ